jgi:hypothetical protein
MLFNALISSHTSIKSNSTQTYSINKFNPVNQLIPMIKTALMFTINLSQTASDYFRSNGHQHN